MTRKHYVAVAEILRMRRATPEAMTPNQVVDLIASDLVLLFAADNPRFDRARFLDACGLGE